MYNYYLNNYKYIIQNTMIYMNELGYLWTNNYNLYIIKHINKIKMKLYLVDSSTLFIF